tara:strand:- start:6570 stop:7223 length:654 start_codon:yes stop_codon:yes gene_type:complete
MTSDTLVFLAPWRIFVSFVSLSRATVVLLGLMLGGCATSEYKTHYGLFTAESASGEQRQFRVYWQTVRYQGWKSNEFRALPVILETQCSKRVLRFYDDSFGKGLRCNDMDGPGISYCGKNRMDTDRRGLKIQENQTCAAITDKQGATDILALEGELIMTISCRPKETEHIVSGKKISTDYLLNSEVPYVIATKSVDGEDIEALVPPLFNHSSVCEKE